MNFTGDLRAYTAAFFFFALSEALLFNNPPFLAQNWNGFDRLAGRADYKWGYHPPVGDEGVAAGERGFRADRVLDLCIFAVRAIRLDRN